MDELLRDFLTETGESLDLVDAQLVRFEQEPNNGGILGNIFRLVHTIKGTCGFLGLSRLETLTHAAETLMGKFRDGMPVTAEAVTLILLTIDRIKSILGELEAKEQEPPGNDADLIERLARMVQETAAPPPPPPPPQEPAAEDADQRRSATAAAEPEKPAAEANEKLAGHSIRVSVDTLDRLMTTVSELVLTRNQLLEIVRRYEESDFKVPLQRLSNVTAELQEGVMKTRMQPIGNAWQKLPRIVRDLCAELGKEIELEMHGAETELDRQVLELVRDPLTHLVRNCADHGIESPAARIAAGKPRVGTIRLTACHQGGHIIIEIADDGRGLDAARIRAKAIETGLASEADLAGKSDGEISNFIFAPGFSTAAQVTSISGRGVGMDVVRSNIEQIGGTVELKSAAGAGTSFIIKIPLTLAIVSALIVEAAGERFAIPQLSVLELVRAGGTGEHRIERIKDTPVLRLRNQLLPLAVSEGRFPSRRQRARQRLRRRDPGRQSGVRRRRRRRAAHRGDRDQADVVEVAAHRGVFRHDHSRRRLGHHDHRPERRGSGARPRRPGRASRGAGAQTRRGGRGGRHRLALGLPRRLASSSRPCRYLWSPASRRSIAAVSRSPTAAISCNIANSSCRSFASMPRPA